jgi:2-polyprenyl-3-methyl-5-hydroxy-6-metoxy-1,4-benzoquinol methylase
MYFTTNSEIEDLARRKAEVVKEHGEWTVTNLKIAEGLWTIREPEVVHIDRRMIRIMQILSDYCPKPLDQCRILDIACAEGPYAIECALRGAEVVATEGRASNANKARFVAEALGLARMEVRQDDVRNLSRESYGEFDVVICSGILYHLDQPDIFHFIEHVAEVCKPGGMTIVDTQISLQPRVSFTHRGRTYSGCYYFEHPPDATEAARLLQRWASIDNVRSAWLTRPSLYNLLHEVGFTSGLEVHTPSMTNLPQDRIMLVCVKGQPVEILSEPGMTAEALDPWPEHLPFQAMEPNDPKAQLKGRLKSLLPKFIRRPLGQLKQSLRRLRGEKPKGPWEWTEPWMRR